MGLKATERVVQCVRKGLLRCRFSDDEGIAALKGDETRGATNRVR